MNSATLASSCGRSGVAASFAIEFGGRPFDLLAEFADGFDPLENLGRRHAIADFDRVARFEILDDVAELLRIEVLIEDGFDRFLDDAAQELVLLARLLGHVAARSSRESCRPGRPGR